MKNKRNIILFIVLILVIAILYSIIRFQFVCIGFLGCNINNDDGFQVEDLIDTEDNKVVILISVDGLRGDLITQSNSPFLAELEKTSSYTLSAQTIDQSETLPAHTSMLTGVKQDKHKVDWNNLDTTKPFLEVNSLFDYLENDKTDTLAIVSKDKLLYYNQNKTDEDFYLIDKYANQFVDDALNIIPNGNNKDMFIFIHLKDVDVYGHDYGWESSEQLERLKLVDEKLQILFTKLEFKFENDDLVFILSADHGGLGNRHGLGRPDDLRIPFIVKGDNITENLEITETVNIYDVTCLTLDIFEVEKDASLDCKTPSGILKGQ